MRAIPILLFIVMLVSCAALNYTYAETTVVQSVGNSTIVSGSDGTTMYVQQGKNLFGSDGSSVNQIGGTTILNDGQGNTKTFHRVGTSIIGSDGSLIQKVGGNTIITDANGNTTVCSSVGASTFCN